MTTTISGTVTSTLYSSDNFHLQSTRPCGVIALRNLAPLVIGTAFKAEGDYKSHKGRRRFEVRRLIDAAPLRMTASADTKRGLALAASITETTAMTPEAIATWLTSCAIGGLPGDLTGRLAMLETDTLEATLQDAKRLERECRIAPAVAAAISSRWTARRTGEAVAQLIAIGVPEAMSCLLVERLGVEAVSAVRRDPWILMDATRASFPLCDRIAENVGLKADCEKRVAAGLARALERAQLAGDTGITMDNAGPETAAALGLPVDAVTATIAAAANDRRFSRAGRVDFAKAKGAVLVQLNADRDAEVAVARFLKARAVARPQGSGVAAAINLAERALALTLDASQREAAQSALSRPLCVITGGPGTGKTTTTRAIVAVAQAAQKRVLLLAPTGRAAKRAADVTGLAAMTIHRALDYNQGKHAFERNARNPLEADHIIVDETSMVDLALGDALFKAIPAQARVTLIGDVDQLPSVGSGNLLGDIIASGKVPIARLKTIHRQGEGSGIISCAHAVNAGEYPSDSGFADFQIEYLEGHEAIVARVVTLMSKTLPAGGHKADSMMTLVATKKGPTGTFALNTALKSALNPPESAPSIELEGLTFSVGDRVMNVKNDYDNDVMNGEIGTVSAVSRWGRTVTVEYPGPLRATYDGDKIATIQHAWAGTIHKSQGSEMDCVILVVDRGQWNASRKLVYTAATRAKKRLIVLTQKDTFAKAVRRLTDSQRLTGLPTLLAQA